VAKGKDGEADAEKMGKHKRSRGICTPYLLLPDVERIELWRDH
jgi:hypothetical protein